MNAAELASHIGRSGSFEPMPGLIVHVHVLDAKMAYGVFRLHVAPDAGLGSAWVNAERVRLFPQQPDKRR